MLDVFSELVMGPSPTV